MLGAKQCDGQVFAVRANWALNKGLMTPDSVGFIDDIDRPKQAVGSMCSIQWLFNLQNLPPNMIVVTGESTFRNGGQFQPSPP